MTKQYRFKHSLIYAVLITTFSSIAVQTNAQDFTRPINADQEFTEDSTIKSEIWGPKTLVYADGKTTDGKTINLFTKNNSSLTITSTYDPEVLAENGGSISFKGFKDLSVSTGQGVFEVKGENSSIETDITGTLSLNSTNKDNFYLINSETGASINLKAGDVTLSGAQAINNFGRTDITSGKDILINTDGSNAIVNGGDGQIFLSTTKNLNVTNTKEGGSGIFLYGNSSFNAKANSDFSINAKENGILLRGNAKFGLGDTGNIIGKLTINADKYAIYSESSGESNIYANQVDIFTNSDQGRAIYNQAGLLAINANSVDIHSNDLTVDNLSAATLNITATESVSIKSNIAEAIKNAGKMILKSDKDTNLISSGSATISASGDTSVSTKNKLYINNTGNAGNAIFLSGSGQLNATGAIVEVHATNNAIETSNSSSFNFGTADSRVGQLIIQGKNSGISSQSSSQSNIYASDVSVLATDDQGIAIYAGAGTLNLSAEKINVGSSKYMSIDISDLSAVNLLANQSVNIKSKGQAVRTSGEFKIQGQNGSALKSLSIESNEGNGIVALGEKSLVEITAIDTEFISQDEYPYANSLSVANKGKIIFKDTGSNEQIIKTQSHWGAMLAQDSSNLTVESGSVDLTGSVLSTNSSTISLGSKKDLLSAEFNLNGENSGSDQAAINARYGTININAAKASVSSSGYAVLATASDFVNSSDSLVNMEVSDSLVINGDISSNIRRNDETVVDQQGTRIININQEKNGSVVINGDVSTISDALTHSEVNIGLKTADSVLTGTVNDEYVGGDLSDVTGGTSLSLENNATWNVTGDSNVSNVTSDNGVIETNGNQLTANNITNHEGGTTIETSSGKANQIRIRQVKGDGLNIHLTDDATQELDANNPEESLAAVANIENSDAGYSITSDEAGVLGDMQLVMDEKGNVVSFTEKANTVNEGLQDIAASNYLFFRSSMNDVNKRMGDLRSMPKSAGAWARYYGGEMKYGDMNMETTYNTLQVGADGWIDNFYLGVSASISDGNGDLDNGSVDNRNYNFGVYGGWVADNGQFVDVIVKRHRMETDGHLSSTSGTHNAFDYYNWGTSVSVEYGWRFNCPSTNFWVEPQAELLYGRMDSVDFRTSQGARVDQDAVDSLIGRLGASVGYTFDQNRGSAYFKASVLHDWKGETESDVTAGGATRSFHDDLGGTWGEFALGGTYNVTDSFSAYGDVLTTTGSPVRNPWQISVGVRYTF